MIDAQKAVAYGLINHMLPEEDLLPFCHSLADRISKNSPVAIGYAIKAINAGFRNNTDGYAAEIDAFGTCFGTADFKEGTTAFLEKRKADFPGA